MYVGRPTYFTDLRHLSNNSDGVGGSNQGLPGYHYISFVGCFWLCVLQVVAVDGLALFVGICCMLVDSLFSLTEMSLYSSLITTVGDRRIVQFLFLCLLQVLFSGYVEMLVRLWVLPNMILARSRWSPIKWRFALISGKSRWVKYCTFFRNWTVEQLHGRFDSGSEWAAFYTHEKGYSETVSPCF